MSSIGWSPNHLAPGISISVSQDDMEAWNRLSKKFIDDNLRKHGLEIPHLARGIYFSDSFPKRKGRPKRKKFYVKDIGTKDSL